MSKEIVITIDKQGNTSVEAFGYKGKACLDATEAFEKILGEVKGRKSKAEMYVTEKAGVKQSIRGE